MQPHRYRGLQESEVANGGHHPRLQTLVTDTWLLVAASISSDTRRGPPQSGTGLGLVVRRDTYG